MSECFIYWWGLNVHIRTGISDNFALFGKLLFVVDIAGGADEKTTTTKTQQTNKLTKKQDKKIFLILITELMVRFTCSHSIN